MKKLAIVTTHPIQYYAPVFQLLHRQNKIDSKVFYTLGNLQQNDYDKGFEKNFTWDIPLLEGYNYQWEKNTAKKPSTYQFSGIVNPELQINIAQYNPDAILIIGWAWDSHLKAIRYFAGKIPVYFRGDSTLLDEQKGIKKIFKKIFLTWLYAKVTLAFYSGTNNKAYFKYFGVTDNRLKFAPHAVDNDRFAVKENTAVLQLKSQLNIHTDDTVILFAGKLELKKDPETLLSAFVEADIPCSHLVFAGSGPLATVLKIKAAGLNNIHFIDFINQSSMPAVYQACDVFCLPSQGPGESWGLAVNEAMACGKAIIASDKCGCAVDLITAGKNGYTFLNRSVADLASCLKQFTVDKYTSKAFGDASAEIIRPWCFENITEAITYSLLHETA